MFACVSLPVIVKVKFEFSYSKQEIVGVLDVWHFLCLKFCEISKYIAEIFSVVLNITQNIKM